MLVRPSFVLGGRAMQIVANESQLRRYLKSAVEIDEDKPVLVDKYIQGREVEIDAICDGRDVFVPGIMELVERTGVHPATPSPSTPPSPSPTRSRASSCNTPRSWAWASALSACSMCSSS